MPFLRVGLTILMDRNNQDSMVSQLHRSLETLVHEVVHSFLVFFFCYCESCLAKRTRVEVLGRIHHGRLFAELLGLHQARHSGMGQRLGHVLPSGRL